MVGGAAAQKKKQTNDKWLILFIVTLINNGDMATFGDLDRNCEKKMRRFQDC